MQLVIEPGRATANYWRDLWRYRELMYFLAWRDVLVRYKQTAIGIAWVLIRPALTMAAFVAFRRLVGVPQAAVPEPVLVFAAVVGIRVWWFNRRLSRQARSTMRKGAAEKTEVIEGEYHVISTEHREDRRPRQ